MKISSLVPHLSFGRAITAFFTDNSSKYETVAAHLRYNVHSHRHRLILGSMFERETENVRFLPLIFTSGDRICGRIFLVPSKFNVILRDGRREGQQPRREGQQSTFEDETRDVEDQSRAGRYVFFRPKNALVNERRRRATKRTLISPGMYQFFTANYYSSSRMTKIFPRAARASIFTSVKCPTEGEPRFARRALAKLRKRISPSCSCVVYQVPVPFFVNQPANLHGHACTRALFRAH